MGQIIAALDLGTSKSIALVVEKDFFGKLTIRKTERFLSNNAIRRGRIYNSDETSDIISEFIRKLNNNSALQIEKIYAGIGGQSLHTQLFSVKREIEDGIVTRQLLDSIEEEANNYKPEFKENLGVVSCEYYADGQLVSIPRGTVASVIEARFQLVVGNPCLKLNLEKVFRGKEISIADYFVSPLATAEAVLTQKEKESGCALIEWGDGVTYISVYKDAALKYLVTIPLGGLVITKDIRSLNVSEDEAETLKIKFGSAIANPDNTDEVPVNEEQNSSRKIELRNLNWIIESRVNEIVKNIWTQIQLSGYSQALDAGIVITGGGALLRDLPQYIRNQTGKEVRLAVAKVWTDQMETQLSPADSCVVGLTVLGKDNCVKATTQEKVSSTDLFGRTEEKKQEKKPEKRQEKKPEKPEKLPASNKSITFTGKIKGFFDRGVKMFDEGASIFKDEDYYTDTTQPVDKNSANIQPENKDDNSANNTNKQ